jgi:predicted O-methyltransferase YrrM
MTQDIYQQVDGYIAGLVAPEDDALSAARTASLKAGLPDIAVSAAEGKLLHVLARAVSAQRILEIGTLGGYSTIWLARALPPNGRLITIEVDKHHADVARSNIARAHLADRVELRVGAALEVLRMLAGPFDLIFIDADKESYVEYFEWAVRLARPGALIVADNVVRKGEVVDAAATDTRVQGAQRFNAALAQNRSVSAAIIQTVGAKGHDGMALAVVNGNSESQVAAWMNSPSRSPRD